MNALTIAVTSYVIAIIISFFVAGLIQAMGSVLARFSKPAEVSPSPAVVSVGAQTASDEVAIAAVIAIAKHN
jgi:hypothetical protein